MARVSFSNADATPRLQHKTAIKQFIKSMFISEGKVLDAVDIIFCSDEYLLSLNKQFLSHDYYTDILTFDLSVNEKVSSEIYISIDRVNDNSQQHNVSFEQELQRIIFHGVLHLCGYTDKTKGSKRQMTQKENEYLHKFSLFHVKQ